MNTFFVDLSTITPSKYSSVYVNCGVINQYIGPARGILSATVQSDVTLQRTSSVQMFPISP